jgi:dienelactone hydrolase
VALDAPPADGVWPLVVISHGNSGTPWAYRQLAKHLVLAGFVVALPAHTGNTRLDNSLAGTAANLANRPRHLTLAIDAVLAEPLGGACRRAAAWPSSATPSAATPRWRRPAAWRGAVRAKARTANRRQCR